MSNKRSGIFITGVSSLQAADLALLLAEREDIKHPAIAREVKLIRKAIKRFNIQLLSSATQENAEIFRNKMLNEEENGQFINIMGMIMSFGTEQKAEIENKLEELYDEMQENQKLEQ